MRLSEERIDFINEQIINALLDEDLIAIEGRKSSLQVDFNRVMLADLAHEDKIDDEVREMIGKMQRTIIEGTPEYNAIFLQKKDELMARDNYIV